MLQILKRKHNYLTPSLPNNVSLTLNKKTENITFNCMFEYFIENDLISPNQSDFKPGGSARTN